MLYFVFQCIPACTVGFLPLMGWSGNTDNGRVCWFVLLAPPDLVGLTAAVGGLALLIVIAIYFVLLYHAIKKIIQLRRKDSTLVSHSLNLRMFRGGQKCMTAPSPEETKKTWLHKIFRSENETHSDHLSKWKAVKVVIFTSGSFTIAWMPFFVTSIVYVISCDPEALTTKCKSIQVLTSGPLSTLGFINTLINPIIYAWWHRGFRRSVKNIYNGFRRKKMALNETQRPSQISCSTASTTRISLSQSSED